MAIEYVKTNFTPFLDTKEKENEEYIPLTPDFNELTLLGYNPSNEEFNTLDFTKELLQNKNWVKDTTTNYNFDGDLVENFDIEDWNPKQITLQYLDSDGIGTPKYDVDKAVEASNKVTRRKSTRRCAKYVRSYLQAGGINIDDRPTTAGQYYNYFRRKKEWKQINPSDVQKGDVCVTVNNGAGHIAFYNGKHWVSDFIQRGPHVYSYAKDGYNTFYFRYTG